jgi:hypothetical protein
MPGPYAHITLLHELMKPGRPEAAFSFPSRHDVILRANFPYYVLGAVSPDYPNLGGALASQWADVMHCTKASEMISSGIKRVRGEKGAVREKQLAWLLGYCAHVATDLTIHPVVQAKVGPYAENQRQHRVCEMNQDSYIYRRMNLGEVGESDIFASAFLQCSATADRTRLDSDIASLWDGMLSDVHPELIRANPPDCSAWHSEFVAMVDEGKGRAGRLFPLSGVISAKIGLSYPSYDAVDRQYVDAQTVPADKPFTLDYDCIFDLAVCNAEALLGLVGQEVSADNRSDSLALGEWDLDTGRNEHDRLVFW